jgi:hypothetical protein
MMPRQGGNVRLLLLRRQFVLLAAPAAGKATQLQPSLAPLPAMQQRYYFLGKHLTQQHIVLPLGLEH